MIQNTVSTIICPNTGWFFSLVPPGFSTKKKTANQPIRAAVLINLFTKKGHDWLLGGFYFWCQNWGVPVKKNRPVCEPILSKNMFLVLSSNMNHSNPKVPSPFVRPSCDTQNLVLSELYLFIPFQNIENKILSLQYIGALLSS